MEEHEIVSFVRGHIEPLSAPLGDPRLSQIFRCAAYLKDGSHLPCLVIASRPVYHASAQRLQENGVLHRSRNRLTSRLRRLFFGEGSAASDVLDDPAERDVQVAAGDIDRLETSRYALPVACLASLQSETSMGFTEFAVRMSDGERFFFGTPWNLEFFDMPPGYSGQDAVSAATQGGLPGPLYRPLPFLMCLVDGL